MYIIFNHSLHETKPSDFSHVSCPFFCYSFIFQLVFLFFIHFKTKKKLFTTKICWHCWKQLSELFFLFKKDVNQSYHFCNGADIGKYLCRVFLMFTFDERTKKKCSMSKGCQVMHWRCLIYMLLIFVVEIDGLLWPKWRPIHWFACNFVCTSI